jgi:acetyl esterase
MHCSDSVYQAVLNIRKNGRKQLEELLPDVVGEEAYIPTRSGETRVLLYTPDREGPLPVYFNVHGGGFIMGHPEGDDAFCQRVSRQYRLPARARVSLSDG